MAGQQEPAAGGGDRRHGPAGSARSWPPGDRRRVPTSATTNARRARQNGGPSAGLRRPPGPWILGYAHHAGGAGGQGMRALALLWLSRQRLRLQARLILGSGCGCRAPTQGGETAYSSAIPPISSTIALMPSRRARSASATAQEFELSDRAVCASGNICRLQDGKKTVRGRHFPRPPFAEYLKFARAGPQRQYACAARCKAQGVRRRVNQAFARPR